MTMRVGVIGTGFGARVVAPVFRVTEGCEVIEVVSSRDSAAVTEMCARTDIDLVSVHSPPFLQVAHVEAAIMGGHAVLCDKPFGRTTAEAAEMCGVANAASVVNLVNFEFRFDPARQRLRELVRSNAIGLVRHISWTHWSSTSRSPVRPHGWLFDRVMGGGWVGAWGSHAVDTLRWLVGEVVETRAELRTDVVERQDVRGELRECDAEDGFTATMLLHNGIDVEINTSFAAPASLAPRLVLFGDDGVIECIGDSRIVVRDLQGIRTGWQRQKTGRDPHMDAMRQWAVVIRDAVAEGTAPAGAPTFADGLACRKVLDALVGERDSLLRRDR